MKKIIALVLAILILVICEYLSHLHAPLLSPIVVALILALSDLVCISIALAIAYCIVYTGNLIRAIWADNIPYPESFLVATSMLLISVAAIWFDKNEPTMIAMALVAFCILVVFQDAMQKRFYKMFTFVSQQEVLS